MISTSTTSQNNSSIWLINWSNGCHTNIYGTEKTLNSLRERTGWREKPHTTHSISCHLAKEYKKWFHITHPTEQLTLKHHLQKHPSINPKSQILPMAIDKYWCARYLWSFNVWINIFVLWEKKFSRLASLNCNWAESISKLLEYFCLLCFKVTHKFQLHHLFVNNFKQALSFKFYSRRQRKKCEVGGWRRQLYCSSCSSTSPTARFLWMMYPKVAILRTFWHYPKLPLANQRSD